MFLLPIGWLYGKIVDIRNALYDRGTLRSHDLGAKTISIGNITTGGTGKTPLVAYVAEILADAGETVCILTRGYGRESSERVLVSDGASLLVDARIGGDEPVELARKLIGKAIVVADADRVSAATWAKEKFGITTFVLDDGFQHRRAKRDLDIVCIDATRPFGSMLREPLENLSRADAIVLTRSELAGDLRAITSKIEAITSEAKLFRSTSRTRTPFELAAFLGCLDNGSQLDQTTPALAFCGLGNPDAFFGSLRLAGYDVKAKQTYRDHHAYSQADIDNLEREAREQEIDAVVTTAKDAVKLKELTFSIPCFVMEIQIEIDNAERFRELITYS